MKIQQLKINFIQDGAEISPDLVDKYELSGRDFNYTYSDKKEKNIYYTRIASS